MAWPDDGVRVYTWATKPTASSYIGTVFISDIGEVNGSYTGSYWVSNGTEWKPLNGHVTLFTKTTAGSAHTGTVTETTLLTYNAPASLPGLNGIYKVTLKYNTPTLTTGTTYFYTRLNTTAMLGNTLTTGTITYGVAGTIMNTNSASAQIGSNGTVHEFAASGSAWNTGAVNTAEAHTINVSVALGGAGNSVTLLSTIIELYHP